MTDCACFNAHVRLSDPGMAKGATPAYKSNRAAAADAGRTALAKAG